MCRLLTAAASFCSSLSLFLSLSPRLSLPSRICHTTKEASHYNAIHGRLHSYLRHGYFTLAQKKRTARNVNGFQPFFFLSFITSFSTHSNASALSLKKGLFWYWVVLTHSLVRTQHTHTHTSAAADGIIERDSTPVT